MATKHIKCFFLKTKTLNWDFCGSDLVLDGKKWLFWCYGLQSPDLGEFRM